ncbi:MAG: D-alanyl-D-alanine carboxypeptidase, partial [Brevibacterium sp.]|nr:D-alanyl-D-alanine carboxypeptidase [Brevibacterium sp.]
MSITAGSLAVVLAGLAAVDAYDVFPELPGILTTDPAIEVQAVPAPHAQAQDVPAPASALDDSAPVPTTIPDKVDKVLSESKVKGFGIEIRDGLSDEVLYAENETKPRTPASVTKVLTASAALLTIGGETRLSTTTEFDPTTATVTLIGGGDSLLGAGESQPGAVNGHAGLTTLAQETAESLQNRNVAEVALDLDTSRYTGEDFSPGWERSDIAKGVIAPIQPLMIDTGYVGSKDKDWRGRSEHPAKDAFAVFTKELKAAGITVSKDPQPADAPDDDAQTGDEAKPTEL